jgi:hypothetical protein
MGKENTEEKTGERAHLSLLFFKIFFNYLHLTIFCLPLNTAQVKNLSCAARGEVKEYRIRCEAELLSTKSYC